MYIVHKVYYTDNTRFAGWKSECCCEILGRIHSDIHNPTNQAVSHFIFVSHRRLIYVPSGNVVQHIYWQEVECEAKLWNTSCVILNN